MPRLDLQAERCHHFLSSFLTGLVLSGRCLRPVRGENHKKNQNKNNNLLNCNHFILSSSKSMVIYLSEKLIGYQSVGGDVGLFTSWAGVLVRIQQGSANT